MYQHTQTYVDILIVQRVYGLRAERKEGRELWISPLALAGDVEYQEQQEGCKGFLVHVGQILRLVGICGDGNLSCVWRMLPLFGPI